MADYLTSADYPSIRSWVHTDLDEDSISDSTLDDLDILEDAEDEVERRGITYSSLTTAQKAKVKRAAIKLAAAYLAPAVRGLVVNNLQRQGLSYTVPAYSGEKRADELREDALKMLNEISGLADTPDKYSFASVLTLRRESDDD